MSNEIKDWHADKSHPLKIQFNYCARGFYCPSCLTGVENKNQKCPYCEQNLIDAYELQ